CGGVALVGWPAALAQRPERTETLKRWLAALPSAEAKVELIERAGFWAKIRRGALPGAGRWTYQYGSPANTSSSDERLARWPLRLLWYGSPGPTRVLHKAQPSPLVAGGRFYLEENNVIMAYDCYNGVRLWQRDLAGAAWGSAQRGSNIACNDQDFFIAIGSDCFRLEGTTGRTEATYPAPDGTRWQDIRVVDNTLFGVCIGGGPTEQQRRRGVTAEQAERRAWILAIDIPTGKVRWRHAAPSIDPGTVAIGDGRVFFTQTQVTADERARAIAELPDVDAAARDIRRIVALAASSGKRLWQRAMDLSFCTLPRRHGSDALHLAYQDGVLLIFGAFWNNHYWGDLVGGRLADRNMIALAADDGRLLWRGLKYESQALGYLTRPCVVGGVIYAHPWAFDLKTGRQIMVEHPITGERIPFQFGRGHHCGLPSGCPNLLIMRSLTTGLIDLAHYTGTIHFRGQRLGCHINGVPAAGLVIAPEASSGCVCPHAVQATVVLQPCPKREETMWGTYAAKFKRVASRGPHYVKRLAVNLGGFGDRRSADGTLWLSYPRPGGTHIELTFGLHIDTLPGFGFFNRSSRFTPVAGTTDPWLYTHGCLGIRRLVVPGTEPDAAYTVRLHFADLFNDQPGRRVFDIKIEDKLVAKELDIVKEAGGPNRALVKEFPGIQADDNITIEFISRASEANRETVPLVCAIELQRQ
ncbi:MAG TPA: hypothetical protein EYH34_02745, partial [Planctomycetes bacterium]|nr:hypothetical protein [Planctomycetota bacterium]